MPLFDKKFVHFMWDDELEGKKGFFADTIERLQDFVDECNQTYFDEVHTEADKICLLTSAAVSFRFFYYDPNYDCKRAYAEGKQIQYRVGNQWLNYEERLNWTDDFEYRIKPENRKYVVVNRVPPVSLCFTENPEKYQHTYFEGTMKECSDYINTHRQFIREMYAWEDGKKIQCMSRIHINETWVDCIPSPAWDLDFEYRIEPVESKRMTYRQLSEWLTKGNGELRFLDEVRTYWGYTSAIEKDELQEAYKIRRWGSDEWIEPTEDIYYHDCGGKR